MLFQLGSEGTYLIVVGLRIEQKQEMSCPSVKAFIKLFTFSVSQKHKKDAGKSDYSVSDYLGALVRDFIRGKKL